MLPSEYTLTKANGQSRKPRNQAEFRSVYIADLQQVAATNGLTLTDVPPLPICRPTSRTGRKALQKTFDADCRRLRRESGAPALTGPPIPGSEHQGHRRFYTLEQCRRGARLSAIARRDQARPRWLQIQTLHYRRYSLRSIARQVDLSLSQVHRVVAGRLWREDGADDEDGGDGGNGFNDHHPTSPLSGRYGCNLPKPLPNRVAAPQPIANKVVLADRRQYSIKFSLPLPPSTSTTRPRDRRGTCLSSTTYATRLSY